MAPRATWVWDRPLPEDLMAWVVAHEVGEIFVAARPDCQDRADLAWLNSVVDRAHAHGVRVAALGGDVGWLGDVDAALAWQAAVLATGLFDAVHVDVEVWTHDDWDARPVQLGVAYTHLLHRLNEACPIPFEADIAFHLHRIDNPSGESLEAAVMRVVDAVTVLSYRNTVTGTDSITDVARSALSTARRLGLRCRLAVETGCLGSDEVSRKQTFYGLGKAALDRALLEVDQVLSDDHAYAGMGVHDYTSWRLL